MGPTPSQKNSQFVVLTSLPKSFNILGIGPHPRASALNEVYGAAVSVNACLGDIACDPGVNAPLSEQA